MVAKKKWIKAATDDSHGQFSAKAKAAGKTTAEFARQHYDAPGRLGKQARLASTLMGISHEKKPRPSRTSVRYPTRDEED